MAMPSAILLLKLMSTSVKKGRPRLGLSQRPYRIACGKDLYDYLIEVGQGYPALGLRAIVKEYKRVLQERKKKLEAITDNTLTVKISGVINGEITLFKKERMFVFTESTFQEGCNTAIGFFSDVLNNVEVFGLIKEEDSTNGRSE